MRGREHKAVALAGEARVYKQIVDRRETLLRSSGHLYTQSWVGFKAWCLLALRGLTYP